MRSKTMRCVTVLWALLAVLAACGDGGSSDKSTTEGNTMAFSLDGGVYPVRLGNFQRNSYIPLNIEPQGRLAWAKAYEDVEEGLTLAPHTVLIREDHIGVVSTEEYLDFRPDGTLRHFEPIGEMTPVVLGRRALAFFDQSRTMIFTDHEYNPLRDEGILPGLDEDGFALLFRPGLDDVLGVVQFTGGPERKPPKWFAYRYFLEDEDYAWEREVDGTIDQALMTADGKSVVLIYEGRVEVLDADTGGSKATFTTGFGEGVLASLTPGSDLVLLGEVEREDEVGLQLAVWTLDGEQVWSFAPLELPDEPQPPACGADGRVYLVDIPHLKCIINGEVAWSHLLVSDMPTWVTVTENNRALVLDGALLSFFAADGEKLWELLLTEEEDEFDAPPAVDHHGRVYVAGNDQLYCVE